MSFKQTVFAAALLLGSSGLALAQSTAPGATTPSNPEHPPTTAPSHNPSTTPRESGSSANPAGNSVRSSGSALEPGANSFTEGQARGRIEDRGYTNVGPLHKDQHSIWQAEATKDGRRVRVGVDYRGNVAEEK